MVPRSPAIQVRRISKRLVRAGIAGMDNQFAAHVISFQIGINKDVVQNSGRQGKFQVPPPGNSFFEMRLS